MDQQEVCLLNFHQQIIVISSQNNVRKYRTKEHEQVFSMYVLRIHSCNNHRGSRGEIAEIAILVDVRLDHGLRNHDV